MAPFTEPFGFYDICSILLPGIPLPLKNKISTRTTDLLIHYPYIHFSANFRNDLTNSITPFSTSSALCPRAV